MNLVLTREPSLDGATIGQLTIGGQIGRLCWTLEDQVRPLEEPKVAGETAIPIGRYRVAINWSQRFKRRMPILYEVPGFEGIRIHWGNTQADTEGCILVGQDREKQAIYKSKAAFDALYDRLETTLLAAEEVWVTVG